MNLILVPVNPSLPLHEFHCTQMDGTSPLTYFLTHHALTNQESNLSNTWVVIDTDTSIIAGYFSLSAASISIKAVPNEKLGNFPPYNNFPAVLVGKFATDDRYRGKGVGKFMMKSIQTIARTIQKYVGCLFITVESKPESMSYYIDVLGFRNSVISGHDAESRHTHLLRFV